MLNNSEEQQYLNLLKDILKNGQEKKDHNTGNSLKSVFGRQIRFNLSKGLPLLTTKKVFWKGVLYELFWFLKGQSNIKYLVDKDVHIWDDYPYKIYQKQAVKAKVKKLSQEEFINKIKTNSAFAKKWGDLPFIYGQLWRKWPAKNGRTIDQIKWVIHELKNFPYRKHIVLTAWNPEYLYAMAEPGKALMYPLCHILFQFNVSNNKLSLQLYQRSADMFLGVPFNIASYSLLTLIIAHLTGLKPGEFVHTFGDAHIYSNHFDQVKEQLARKPKAFPRITIEKRIKDLDLLEPEHIILHDYKPYATIKAKLTVAGGFDEKDRKGFKLS